MVVFRVVRGDDATTAVGQQVNSPGTTPAAEEKAEAEKASAPTTQQNDAPAAGPSAAADATATSADLSPPADPPAAAAPSAPFRKSDGWAPIKAE